MLAVSCTSQSAEDPLSGLTIGEVDAPADQEGWVRVHVRACALNHHDLWSLRGQALGADRLPMILGDDAAGVLDDGTEVVVHAVVGEGEDETLDPKRTLLSELHPGTLAEQVLVPERNVVPKPTALSFEEAACLPTAWLTAYRMLTTRSGLGGHGSEARPSRVLVQGAGGGVATAAIALGKALGHEVIATSRDERKREQALELGADEAVPSGERLSKKVDVVLETVGKATWDHSLRSLRPGGRIVVSGATSGPNPGADLNRVFFLQLEVVGSTMGTRDELEGLLALLDRTGVRPTIAGEVRELADARRSFEELAAGDVFGKLVLTT